MKDIESLYLAAKSSGRASDVDQYTEAVYDLLRNDPAGYMSQLEYIISSSVGLSTFREFVEKNGLPIACYDDVMTRLQECVRQCGIFGHDDAPFQEVIQYMENFRQQYSNCFAMYESVYADAIEVIEERSHGTLKNDFRAAIDANTGHVLKIVYDLDNIIVTNDGMNWGKKKKIKEVQDNIRKMGNVDHESKNQKVLAIVDQYTGERLPEADCTGIFNIGEGIPEKLFRKAEEGDTGCIKAYLKKQGKTFFHVKVGEIEQTPSFKSTHWTKGMALGKAEGNDRLSTAHRISSLEANRFGRGWQIHRKEYIPKQMKALAKGQLPEDKEDTLIQMMNPEEKKVFTKYVKKLKKELKDLKALGDKGAKKKALKYRKEILDMIARYQKQLKTNNVPPELQDALDMANALVDKKHRKFLAKTTKRVNKKLKEDKRAREEAKKGKTDETSLKKEYVETYYGRTETGTPNRLLVAGMIEQFGEMAIPDMLITAEQIGPAAVCSVMEYVYDYDVCFEDTLLESATFFEWIVTTSQDVTLDQYARDYVEIMQEDSLSAMVNALQERCNQTFRESMIMDNPELEVEFTESEVEAVYDLIAFKEYQMLGLQEGTGRIDAAWNEIKALYELAEGLIPEEPDEGDEEEESVADSVLPMLPGTMRTAAVGEGTKWIVNTRNKKTGETPNYLSDNHNLKYGEEDDDGKSIPSEDTGDLKLDDIMRPSAAGSPDPKISEEEPMEEPSSDGSGSGDPKGVTNYYYYTYTNSLNKNSNSFNRDHSQHDDHSVSSKSDDHSSKEDHSTHTMRHIDHSTHQDDHSSRSTSNDNHSSTETHKDDHSSHTKNMFTGTPTKESGEFSEEDCALLAEIAMFDMDLDEMFAEAISDLDAPDDDDIINESVDMDDEVFTEKSHGALKFDYRMGYDIETGKKVAIQFELDPSKITGVAEPKHIRMALKKSGKKISKDDANEMAADALEKTKKEIRRNGHIDHVTKKLKVTAIFHQGGRNMDSVKMVPVFSEVVRLFLASVYSDDEARADLKKRLSPEQYKDFVKRGELTDILEIKEYRDEFLKFCKSKDGRKCTEEYHVGEKAGKDKYKTTKLAWRNKLLYDYRYSPMARGVMPPLDKAARNTERARFTGANRPSVKVSGANKDRIHEGVLEDEDGSDSFFESFFGTREEADDAGFFINESTYRGSIFEYFETYLKEAFEEFDERSHGKLKVDHRAGWDYDTGHAIHIIYSLDNIQVNAVGNSYARVNNLIGDRETISDHPEHPVAQQLIAKSQKNIRKTGQLDHDSSGQVVTAIKDLATGKTLRRCRYVGVFNAQFNHVGGAKVKIDPENLKKIHEFYDSKPELKEKAVSTIEVGKVEARSLYKSTHWPKHLKLDPDGSFKPVIHHISNVEQLGFGRGAKINDAFGYDDNHVTKFKHPSKKDLKRSLERTVMEEAKHRIHSDVLELIRYGRKEFARMYNKPSDPRKIGLINFDQVLQLSRFKSMSRMADSLIADMRVSAQKYAVVYMRSALDKRISARKQIWDSAVELAKTGDYYWLRGHYDFDADKTSNQLDPNNDAVKSGISEIILKAKREHGNPYTGDVHPSFIRGVGTEADLRNEILRILNRRVKQKNIEDDRVMMQDDYDPFGPLRNAPKYKEIHNESYDSYYDDLFEMLDESGFFDGIDDEFTEEVGDVDDMKPESDHPVKDTLMDIDRTTVKYQQKMKRKVQDVQNVGRAAMKPANRMKDWVLKMANHWKDKDENDIKEKMADPHARKNIFSAITWCIKWGMIAKAGLLFNPIFLALAAFSGYGKSKKHFRLRNEMIGEIKAELEIIDDKINLARREGDTKQQYQLTRLKNELNKKLLRVGGGTGWRNHSVDKII